MRARRRDVSTSNTGMHSNIPKLDTAKCSPLEDEDLQRVGVRNSNLQGSQTSSLLKQVSTLRKRNRTIHANFAVTACAHVTALAYETCVSVLSPAQTFVHTEIGLAWKPSVPGSF